VRGAAAAVVVLTAAVAAAVVVAALAAVAAIGAVLAMSRPQQLLQRDTCSSVDNEGFSAAPPKCRRLHLHALPSSGRTSATGGLPYRTSAALTSHCTATHHLVSCPHSCIMPSVLRVEGQRLPTTGQVAAQQGAYVARLLNRGYVLKADGPPLAPSQVVEAGADKDIVAAAGDYLRLRGDLQARPFHFINLGSSVAVHSKNGGPVPVPGCLRSVPWRECVFSWRCVSALQLLPFRRAHNGGCSDLCATLHGLTLTLCSLRLASVPPTCTCSRCMCMLTCTLYVQVCWRTWAAGPGWRR
jgi:hypothetical protein